MAANFGFAYVNLNYERYRQSAILLVEDEQDDVFLMRLAVEKTGIWGGVRVVEDGLRPSTILAAQQNFRPISRPLWY